MKREDFKERDVQRFWSKVSKGDPCWWWHGYTDKDGYGIITHYVDAKKWTRKAHRIAYLLAHGQIDPGLTIDHLCRNRRCVNPAHLELVSMKENTFRGVGPASINVKKTSCMRGHPLSGENLYLDPRDGHRACKACRDSRKPAWRRNATKPHKDTCKHGHPWTEQSTYTARTGVRFCRLCKKLSGGGNLKTMFIKEIFA